MSVLPVQLQSQTTYAIDAVQESNSQYYFVQPGDISGGGSTSNLVSPVVVSTLDASQNINNGITINSDNTNTYHYGLFVQDVNPGNEILIALVAEGDGAILQIGNAGEASSYFRMNQSQTTIGNTDSFGTALNLISWNPVGPSVTLKLNNPTRITGSTGDGIPYDTVYNPVVPYNTLVQGTILKQFNNVLGTTTTNSYTAGPNGQLVNIRILVSIQPTAYNFPAGSILGIGVGFDGVDNNGGWVIPLPTTAPNAQTEGATFQTGGLYFVQPGGLINAFFVGGGASINLGTSLGGNGNITVLLELVGTSLQSSA